MWYTTSEIENRRFLMITHSLNSNNMSTIYTEQPKKREYFNVRFCYDTINSPNSSMQHDADICNVSMK